MVQTSTPKRKATAAEDSVSVESKVAPAVMPAVSLEYAEVTDEVRKVLAHDLNEDSNFAENMWVVIEKYLGREPAVAVELNSRRGAWSCGLMENTKNTRCFSIDTWDGAMGLANCGSWLKRLESESFRRSFPLRGDAVFWSKAFPYKVDVLYATVPPTEQAFSDLYAWRPFVRDGGLVVGVDYKQEVVKEAVDKVFPDKEVIAKRLGPGSKVITFIVQM